LEEYTTMLATAMHLLLAEDVHSVWLVFPRGFWGWIILGLVAGWLAGKLSRGRGYGCITDIILGLIGSVIGGWIFTKLNIMGGGIIYSLAAATLGAVVLVAPRVARSFLSQGHHSIVGPLSKCSRSIRSGSGHPLRERSCRSSGRMGGRGLVVGNAPPEHYSVPISRLC
jgi:uncharacterized membrane protein YeaQ/YmgE (transglycosylase-associated protein family)